MTKNVDKALEQAIIAEMVLTSKKDLEYQQELPEIIEEECNHMEQVLSKGATRELIRSHIVDKLSDKEKLIYLEYLNIQPKLFRCLVGFGDELNTLLMEEVVEQSEYSEAKTKKQLH